MRLTDDLKDLATVPAFRTLLGVRLVSQTGDGMVQAGLATLFFFQPQNMTTAAGVASALVVMLLPFSLVGPFTGPFIDRWRRRQTLLWGNLLRAGLIALTALVLHAAGTGAAVYVLVLVALGINRFLLSVLSAGLPQVIDHRRLLVANSLVPTLGGAATATGAVIGIILRLLLPAGSVQDAASLVSAVVLYVLAAAVVTRLGAGELGPEHPTSEGTARALAATVCELADAVRYLRRRGTPGLALSTMALHRFVYGMQLITIILTSRNLLAAPEDADLGLALFGTLMGAMIAGHGLSIVLTPLAHERVAPSTWIVMCLLGGSLGQLVLVASHAQAAMTVGLLIFGAGVQGAKIAVDTIVQSDTADAYRGRAFSIYDVLFNTAECVAAGVAVLVLPDVGWSRPAQAALVLFVWCVALWYLHGVRRLGDQPREVAGLPGLD
ncbi:MULTISPECIES: MFS transporter [unclassified Actinomyces]|uniref:MFS transporter n=1 Tax=unclassified Actinomyces TaxID=2609248 RepID=UPI0020181152|nr:MULTISPECIES: MFS transporter [unclassified Actinomyces]MCL3777872.1 MFS transporter [Actinomyces sp. AC-20-1]MCL3789247.1 MFS transporter [Actinomyces sp. 187325]MCL3791600.1 MFS transporter [Actinomyces sp. 186855]MCL3793542.1 MFS transporter [Actinomyces sp. 217892]